ncbi:histidine phosphatase family protein [Actinomadura sp. LD22]|uniref:Histidine phosphatase family protein n=1 Tax=Actinomadura physcomitrii TaxID=2650748 RepID=A0A6I4MEB2_9ACTN|nr:histidine phosphatase family protein [Actinomadura physcomitrii]MWA03220.1 histidine phosphatase family protein [Actinomadura physcomitrii]
MELALIRHAEPRRAAGADERRDPGLSDAGRAQAERIAARLAGERWDALYSSPQRRALETAEIVSARLALPVQVEEGLAEFDRGAEYLHVEDAAADDERLLAFRREDFSAYGTDAATIRRNARTALEAIVAANPGRRVAVISHGAVINAYVGSVIGVERLVFHRPAYTGMTRLLISRQGVGSLQSLNESAHLCMPQPRTAQPREA